jgi:cell wall-associated NlpC family hydrolase
MKRFIFLLCILFSTVSYGQYNPKFSSFMNKWIDVPYKFGGSTIKGIDCSKLTQRFYKDVFHIIIPGTAPKQYRFMDKVRLKNMTEGDIIFFKSKLSPSGWHCGIYLGNDHFLHAPRRGERVKISSLDEKNYRKNIIGCGRVKM